MAATLFDDYGPKRRRKRRDRGCCPAWDAYDGPHTRAMELLHQLAHSRVPFTTDYLADVAGLDADRALMLAIIANRLGWIEAPPLDGEIPAGAGLMWVGRLHADRRR